MSTTRERLVAAAAEVLLPQGYAATGLKQLTARSGVPTGSLYHHFPGGKEELAAEAIRVAGAGYQAIVEAVIAAEPDLVDGIAGSFVAAGEVLRASGFADACPIATVALEVASSNERLRLATAEVFEGWIATLSALFAQAGVDPTAGRRLAHVYLTALEGAFLLCRAARTTEALEAVGPVVAAQVAAALRPLSPPGP